MAVKLAFRPSQKRCQLQHPSWGRGGKFLGVAFSCVLIKSVIAESTAQSLDLVSFQSTGWGLSIFSCRRVSSSFLNSLTRWAILAGDWKTIHSSTAIVS